MSKNANLSNKFQKLPRCNVLSFATYLVFGTLEYDIHIRHLPWISGDFKARMGHQIAFNLAKTGSNVFSQSLQFRVLFIRDFEPAVQNLFTSFKPILMLVWVTPISNLKYILKIVKGQLNSE